MRAASVRLAPACVLAGALLGCVPEDGSGFVQIKIVPASPVSQPALYLDSSRLDVLKKGEAVLSRKSGTVKLQAQAAGGQLTPLCDIVVKKNRITSVTVSVLERPPRCQCRHDAADGRPSNRICIG